MKAIFILVPSMVPTGPIKGAVALANFLVDKQAVTLVSVKKGPGCSAFIDERIKCICLAQGSSGTYRKVNRYKTLLLESGSRVDVASISFCFSADLINSFCSAYATTCSSVRGNLIKIYRMDYGLIGLPVAILHLVALFRFDKVVAMSAAMAKQIKFFSSKESSVVGNFVDETSLSKYKNTKENMFQLVKRFVFVGSISERKNPLLLVRTIKKLRDDGHNVELDLIGEGPLMEEVISEIKLLELERTVVIHGHLADPYPVITKADVFVLPSMSEGTSRASLEALYLGLPCVLRDIDGNSELITKGVNGSLFSRDERLPLSMLEALEVASGNGDRDSFLPNFYRQSRSAEKYLEIVSNT
jgi:glycosyltransferase involved in cell wall biosynthesis